MPRKPDCFLFAGPSLFLSGAMLQTPQEIHVLPPKETGMVKLLIHDLDILLHLVRDEVQRVDAVGVGAQHALDVIARVAHLFDPLALTFHQFLRVAAAMKVPSQLEFLVMLSCLEVRSHSLAGFASVPGNPARMKAMICFWPRLMPSPPPVTFVSSPASNRAST